MELEECPLEECPLWSWTTDQLLHRVDTVRRLVCGLVVCGNTGGEFILLQDELDELEQERDRRLRVVHDIRAFMTSPRCTFATLLRADLEPWAQPLMDRRRLPDGTREPFGRRCIELASCLRSCAPPQAL
jgi:hypothetical protein